MTAREIIDFATKQIEWHMKDIEWNKGQIEFCNRELKRTRKEDAELKAWALERQPDDPLTLRIYGGKYVGKETRKYINERARHYRDIKHDEKWIAKYRKQVTDWERYL